jgi:hypothetical protein
MLALLLDNEGDKGRPRSASNGKRGMKFARFWSRQTGEATDHDGRRTSVVARGWSDDNLDAAAAMARTIAARVAEFVSLGQTKLQRYQYGDRPIPEPVLREFNDGAGLRAAVTRNVYGALVLNTRDMMFVDVDVDPPNASAATLLSGIASLFGKRSAPEPAPADPIVERFRRVADAHGLSMRDYKTAGGYRGLVTSASFGPSDGSARALLDEFGTDTLYVRLCEKQNSFRARMTPKPWRIDLRPPAVAFPYETPQDQSRFDAWQAEYDAASAQFAVCEFVAEVGQLQSAGLFDDLIAFHDEQTKATTDLPLA